MNDQLLFPEQERTSLRIICILLSAGIVLLSFVAVLVPLAGSGTHGTSPSTMAILRLIHFAITLIAVVLQKYLYDRMLSGKIKTRAAFGTTMTFGRKYLIATIVRLAILEGASLSGLIVLMAGTIAGSVKDDPTYYLHLIPVVLLLAAAWVSYPSEGRVGELTREYQAV